MKNSAKSTYNMNIAPDNTKSNVPQKHAKKNWQKTDRILIEYPHPCKAEVVQASKRKGFYKIAGLRIFGVWIPFR